MATPGDDAGQVLARADVAMYDAKRASRKRVGAAPPVRVVSSSPVADGGSQGPGSVGRALGAALARPFRRRRKAPMLEV